MAYGNLLADVVQSSVTGTPPQFNDGAGTQTGTLCRAWVNFNGSGSTSIRGSFNVSSVTYNSTADYTVNFTNAMSSVNYAVTQAVSSSSVAATYRTTVAEPRVFNTTSLRLVAVYDSNILLDSYIVCIAIFV